MGATLLKKQPAWLVTLLAALSAFCVYTSMYAFRKPFTAAAFEGNRLWGVDYKIWLVIAQTFGYTVSKFFGISFIAGMKNERRAITIIKLIAIAWIALLFFALFPPPYNIIFLLINGFPLGVIYGLVFSYLEGRRSTELLGAVLATSFIFASGFTQSVGKYVMLELNVSEWWMPWVTGLIFFLPLVFFTWLLERTPLPDQQDIAARTQRQPMTKKDRVNFIRTFFPGLVLLIIAYVMLTIIRDYRSNFASDIWNELGYGNSASVFTTSELPASLVVLVLMGLLILVRKNINALLINHVLIIAGFLIAICCTLLYMNNQLPGFWWMTLTGVGLYMGYVPFNCMLFERLIASFKYISNAGFIIYVADSFGYLGSDVVLLVKNFGGLNRSWTDFFIQLVLFVSATGIVLVVLSMLYFKRKYNTYFGLSSPSIKLNYG
jgi:MFS family permease